MEVKSSCSCTSYKKISYRINSQNLVIAVLLILTFSIRFQPVQPVLQVHDYSIFESSVEDIAIENILITTRIRNCQSFSWPFLGMTLNMIMRMVVGNRKLGYNLGVWNCRKGLVDVNNESTNKLMDVKLLLQQHDLHVLGLIECDLHGTGSRVRRRNPISTKEINDSLHIEGYSIKLPQSWYVHGQARIIVYVKDGVTFKLRNLKHEDADLPSITGEVSIGREKRTCVNFFYREWTGGVSGTGDNISQAERLSRQVDHWKSLYSSNRDVVIMGDANFCAFKWKDESYQYKSLACLITDHLLETSSSQLVRKFTRSETYRNTVQRSCLDHCYCDSPDKISVPLVVSAGDSDHLAVVVKKFTKAPVTRPQTVRKRNYKYFSVGDFLVDVYNSDINSTVTAKDDLEEAAKVFQYTFSSVLDCHAPMKTYQLRKNYSPCLSLETKQIKAERDALKEEATLTGNQILLKEHKIKVKEFKKAAKKDKKEHYEKNSSDEVTVSKAWRTARDILGITKNLSPSIITHEGEQISNPTRMANIFNRFFVEKVQKLRNKTISHPSIDPVQRLRDGLEKRDCNPPPFSLKPITVTTLRKLIKRMKGKRSHGVDNIDSYSLKLAGPLMEDALLHLVNLSIEQGEYSGRWKPQIICPLHKKEDKRDIKNYRPVSHLVEIGKLVEYAVYEQVVEHFTANGLFHPNHHGSLSNHSTATALIQLMDMWLVGADKTELSAVLLLDQSAAYDLMDHSILAAKLKVYNFDEKTIGWFLSYLQGRSQIVQVESKQSDQIELGDHAVPQGSVLGGLLFIIFSNDFPDSSHEGESVLYVDDDTDVAQDKNPSELENKIQREAERSASWLKDNRMCVAGEKSKLLVVGTRELKKERPHDTMEILVDGKAVKETPSERLLGVTISNDLTWYDHLHGEDWREDGKNIQGLIPQLSQRVGMLKKLSKYMSKDRLKDFVSGIFYSKLEYCLPVFGNVFGIDVYSEVNRKSVSFTREDNRKLQVVQNSVMRLLSKLDRSTPTENLLLATDSLSIQQLIAMRTLMMVKKITMCRQPDYLARRLTFAEDIAGRRVLGRSQHTLTPVDRKLSVSRGGFLYRGCKLFNSLPIGLRNQQKIGIFKPGVRSWVKTNIDTKQGLKK